MSDPHDTHPPAPTSAGNPAVLSEHAQGLLNPVSALLKTLARISLQGAALKPEQRALVASLSADVDVLGRRIAQLLEPASLAFPVPDEHPAARPAGELPRVLRVDDDFIWLEAAAELLGRHFRVLVARDAYEAGELLVRERPDAMVSDLSMPGSSGLALLELARCRPDTAEIPILVLSGASDTETKIRAFELGATDYLTKPIALAELVARVRNALTRAETLKRERLLQETDDLTGLANRRALRKILQDAIRYAASARRPLTVAMVDQDKLKQINDRFGHAAGDAAIRALAKALAGCKRGSDCAARYGGDEFCVVMPGSDRLGAEKFVTRVQEELVASPINVGGVLIQVSASFGLASLGEVAWEEEWEELLARADQALYEEKSSRRAAQLAEAAEAFFRTWDAQPDSNVIPLDREKPTVREPPTAHEKPTVRETPEPSVRRS